MNYWPILTAGGTALNVMGQLERGKAAQLIAQRRKQLADFQAEQLQTNAGQAQAAGQIAALNERRNTALVASKALAAAAASGAGASDPTVMNVISKIQGEGAYRSMLDLYQGETQARQLREQAAATEYGGAIDEADAAVAKKASYLGALTTALSGAARASLYDKYFPREALDAETP